MAKTCDIPAELRGFNTLFEKLTYRYTNDAQAFDDFLSYAIACFLTTGDPETADRLQKVYGRDYPVFGELLREWIAVQDKMIAGDHDWYDGLGHYYEAIASRSKSSRLGQFFTPSHICDMMVMMQTPGPEKAGGRLRIADPCSGSGRMLVASHVLAPGNRQYGADLDPMCAKMTALNMLIHGCVGEAVCMDSLQMEWRFGYSVNHYLSALGVPTLERIEQAQSYIGCVPMKPETEASTTSPQTEPKTDKRGQFVIF